MEYIDYSGSSLEARAGQTMAEHGFRLTDDKRDNFINGIRVDYGGQLSPENENKHGLDMDGKRVEFLNWLA